MILRPGSWWWRALFGALLLSILYLALSPRPPQSVDTGWDKLNHVFAFAALAWSGTFSGPGHARWMRLLAAALMLFGAGIEVVQSFIPERSGEWADLLGDGAGIALGLTFAALMRGRLRAVT